MTETKRLLERNCWAVVPAAGIGARMQADRPKQYLPLAGRTVLEHTLSRLCDYSAIKKVVVVLQAEDDYWPNLALSGHEKIQTVTGGHERCNSVLNALLHLRSIADEHDWVLVHDAARPCIQTHDLDQLLDACDSGVVQASAGCVLGVPVRDTMKRTDATGCILQTVERELLWQAYTPQVFRLGQLLAALQSALAAGKMVTDEASAMELAGHRVQMVLGAGDNIKITRPEDLSMAEFFLNMQAKHAG